MQTQLIARLLEKHPDSLPLLMMRGNAMLVSGKPAAALRNYFMVWAAAFSAFAALCINTVLHVTSVCVIAQHLRGGPRAHIRVDCMPISRRPQPADISVRSGRLTMTACSQAYQMLPEDPVINLAIAVAHLTHACSRAVGDRHACILKAFAFFCRHARFSSNRQEACYNLARAFHQLELNHMAVEWYERALVLGGASSGADSLAFEAGHNLALIYEGSGAAALARRTRALYCSV